MDELWQLRALLLEHVLRLAVTPVTTAARASTRERDILIMRIKTKGNAVRKHNSQNYYTLAEAAHAASTTLIRDGSDIAETPPSGGWRAETPNSACKARNPPNSRRTSLSSDLRLHRDIGVWVCRCRSLSVHEPECGTGWIAIALFSSTGSRLASAELLLFYSPSDKWGKAFLYSGKFVPCQNANTLSKFNNLVIKILTAPLRLLPAMTG